MASRYQLVLGLLPIVGLANGTRADEVKKAEPRAVAAEVDRLIDQRLLKDKVPGSPQADDAEFLRRAYLDLTGRIPKPDKAAAFLDSTDSDKRSKLIDELLASPEYGRHFGNVWHDLIIPRTPLPAGTNPEALRNAFADCFNNNVPWGEVAGRVALCQGGTAEKSFMAFYRVNGDMGGIPMANAVTRSYARLFLGIRMECAECHDDPYKPWKQAQYWGISAYFGRVVLAGGRRDALEIAEGTGYKTPKGNDFKLTVNPAGALAIHKEAYRNVGQFIQPCVLGGTPATFSPGQPMLPELARWMAAADNPYLARAAVNRLWAHLFARGLLNPIDDFHADQQPAHPELLRMLAEEFTRSGHDVKHLLRCLCNSQAYQRTSRPAPGNDQLDDPLFSRMALKPLTAEMLFDSLAVAYDSPELFPRSVQVVRNRPTSFARKDFMRLFNTNDVEGDPSDYTHGIPQVLHLMNVPLYNAGGTMVAKLLTEETNSERVIESLYLSTLSRRPTPDEVKRKLELVRQHPTVADGLKGVLWTLVNQSEFLINH